MKDQEIKKSVIEIILAVKSVKKIAHSEVDQINIDYKLKKAVLYGVRFKIETLLVIATMNGDIKIRSIIFRADEKSVRLKGRILIPTASIKEIEFIL